MRIIAAALLLSLFTPAVVAAESAPVEPEATDARTEAVNAVWSGQALETVEDFDCPALRHVRNAVYARHGYTFTEEWVVQQFADDARYVPDAYVTTETIEPMLTPADTANVQLVIAAEVNGQCEAYWSGEYQSGEEAPEPPPEPEWVLVEIWSGGIVGNGDFVEAWSATPDALVNRALSKRSVQDTWLEPLSCEQVKAVGDAVYARHNFPFADAALADSFRDTDSGYYANWNVTDQNVDGLLAQRDRATLYAVGRVSADKDCTYQTPKAAPKPEEVEVPVKVDTSKEGVFHEP